MRSLFVFLGILCPLLFASPVLAKKLLILGDSLTEGYGVAREAAFPALLERRLKNEKKNWVVINAGVSGSTSASAVSRLKWQLKSKPDLVVIWLGANDGLRGLSVDEMEKNLSAAVSLVKEQKIPVVLAEMMMPPNYTQDYANKFKTVFMRVAKKQGVKLIPFLLRGVAGDAALNLPDGIHPNEKGHQIMADHLYRELKELL